MFGKNRKMNFLGGKPDKSASKTTTSFSNADAIYRKASAEFRKSLTKLPESDPFFDISNSQTPRASSFNSSSGHLPLMSSTKSLPPEPSTNNSKKPNDGSLCPSTTAPHKKDKTIAPHPSIQPPGSLPVKAVKPKLLRSSVNNNQISKITEKLDRSRQDNKELTQKLGAKRQEIERIKKEYSEYMKSIRAVDEDHCTITEKLNRLHTNINQFLMNVKGDIADPTTAVKAFLDVKGWGSIEPAVRHLLQKNPSSTASTITRLAEKFINEHITKSIYNSPIYLGLPQNDAFVDVCQYMEGYNNWATRLRQQLCTIVTEVLKEPSKNSEIYKAIEAAKTQLIMRMLNTLSLVYSHSVHEKIEARLRSYVEEAATISLAMHSLPNVVHPYPLTEGVDKVNPEWIDLSYGSAAENDTIQMVVCPPFTYEEDGVLNILTKGKVVTF
ncbi:hypothetical protein BX666DRAFT_2031516 [Dichotomocladium elegans]|nr:hypothetical protein BX666DRAFT_2031516 [Dichotomocladium elegans]